MPNAPGMTLSLHVRESKTVLDYGFHAVDSGCRFWIWFWFWILDSLSCIQDSKSQQSGYRIKKFRVFQDTLGFWIGTGFWTP